MKLTGGWTKYRKQQEQGHLGGRSHVKKECGTQPSPPTTHLTHHRSAFR